MSDERVGNGIWATKYGWRFYARINGRLRPKRIADPQHRLGLVELRQQRQDWIADERKTAKVATPRRLSGRFEEDAATYLATTNANKDATYQINLWVAEFRGRQTNSIHPWEILAVMSRWLKDGPRRVWRRWRADGIDRRGGRFVEVQAPLSASQVTKRKRKLQNLYTVLNTKHGYNPAREVPEPEEPEAEPRDLPYDVIEAILGAVPNHFVGVKKDGTRTLGKPRVPDNTLRMRIIAYAGLSHSELMGVDDPDLHLDEPVPWVYVAGRKKGKGTDGAAMPLLPQAVEAFRELATRKKLGRFSPASLRKAFVRRCQELGIRGIRPYDLRHSYATTVLMATKNLATTQMLMRHKHRRTTLRYSKRAVNPVLAAAIAQAREAGSFGVTSGVTLSRQPATNPNESRQAGSRESSRHLGRNRQ